MASKKYPKNKEYEFGNISGDIRENSHEKQEVLEVSRTQDHNMFSVISRS